MAGIKINHFSFLLLCLILLGGCDSNESSVEKITWDPVIREVQIILAQSGADSVKYQRIKTVFETYGISLAEYRRFYEVYTRKYPDRNIALLQKVEEEITEEMKLATEEYRKLKEEERRQDALQKLEEDQQTPPRP